MSQQASIAAFIFKYQEDRRELTINDSCHLVNIIQYAYKRSS